MMRVDCVSVLVVHRLCKCVITGKNHMSHNNGRGENQTAAMSEGAGNSFEDLTRNQKCEIMVTRSRATKNF